MTWGELRKCRARTRSSKRSGVGGGDGDACSDEGLGSGVSVERGLDSDGTAGCELSSLLAVIATSESLALGRSGFPCRYDYNFTSIHLKLTMLPSIEYRK